MRTVGVVTTNRSDYGLYRPILRRIAKDRGLKLVLYVSGAHLSAKHGNTVTAIESDKFGPIERVPLDLTDDSPAGIARTMGQATQSFARAFQRRRPDLLLVLGDRFEMFAAAAAATPLLIPLAHIHGGEITEGAIDNSFRHAMTKLAHIHFVSNEQHRARVVQMGEEPWRVHVSGAPGLDNISQLKTLLPQQLARKFGLAGRTPPLLVTFHPETMEAEETEAHTGELLAALKASRRPVVFTAPSNDTNGSRVRKRIEAYLKENPSARLVESFGVQGYFSMMKWAAAMLGNSSSGLIEAPSFGLPVVNIGDRQKGRLRANNVIDCAPKRREILKALQKALAPSFRSGLKGKSNPYGDGKAAQRIVDGIKQLKLGSRLLVKKFVDASVVPGAVGCVVIGGGGHAKVVIDALLQSKAATPVGIVDPDRKLWGKRVLGVPVLGNDQKIALAKRLGATAFVIGVGSVGDSRLRKKLFNAALAQGLSPLTVVHPSAVVANDAVIGAGSVVFAGVKINPGAKIGRNVILNTGAIIEHDCRIGDHAHIAPAACLAGLVNVGAEAHVGARAVVKQGILIGKNAVVGAGAVVLRAVAPGTTVVGSPARQIDRPGSK